MQPTLADVLNEPSLRLTCLAAHAQLNRPISRVHVAEVNDPTPWLTSGVLLLTTGLVERSTAELDRYFASLSAHEIAAVAFGVGIVVDEVPAEWTLTAERHGVPLLRVPLDVPYIAIAEHVTQRHTDAQLAQVKRMLDVQQRLAFSGSDPRPRHESLTALAQELDAAVVLRAESGSAQSIDPSSHLGESLLSAIQGELDRHALSGRRTSGSAIGEHFVQVAGSGSSPIAVVRSRRYSPLEQSMIGSIATFIGVSGPAPAPADFTTSFREQILTASFSGRIDPDPNLFGIVVPRVDACVTVHLGQSPDPEVLRSREPAAGLLLKAHFADRAADTAAMPLLCPLEYDFLLILPEADSKTVCAEADAFLRAHSGSLGSWRAGVSTARPAAELLQAAREAKRAQQATRYRPEARALEHSLLARRSINAEALQRVFDSPVFTEWREELAALEPAAAARIVATLRAYLAENGAIEKAAAALGVHRQTLRTRLNEAEKVLDVSLAAPTERALLWLALDSGAAGLETD